jgi:hypothetical protein
MATERLKVILEMAAGQYKREAKEASTATGKLAGQAETAGTKTDQLGGKMSKFGGALRGAAVLGGIVAVGRGLGTAIEAAEQSASALANTQQIIKETGGIANVTADDILELSNRLGALTGVEDEVVQEGANVLLTFKNLRNEVGDGNDVFDRTAALMLDIGAVMGTDTTSAALQLGKALNDPVSQMGALSRAGLTFDASQKEMIKDLVESGNLLEAQKIILGELESQLGGTAAASADASEKIGNAMGELAEGVGTLLLPVLDTAAVEIQALIGQIDELDKLAATTGQARESAELLLGSFALLSKDQGLDKDFAEGIEDFNREAEKLIDISGLTISELQRTRDGLDVLVEGGHLSAEAAEALAVILDQKLNEELARLTDAGADKVLKGQLAPAFEETSETAEESAIRIQEAADAAGEVQREADAAAEAQRNLRRSFLELADPIFAANDAMGRLRDAQQNLIDVQEDVDSTAQDVANAQLEVASAALGAQGALEELGDGNLTGGIARIAEALGVSDDEARDLLETLGLIDGTEVETVVNTRFTTSGTAPSRANPTGTFRGLASGGSMRFGETAVVGERGPELFTAPANGQIISNEMMNRITNSTVTSHYPITVQASGDPNVDAQTVGAIASVLRRIEGL